MALALFAQVGRLGGQRGGLLDGRDAVGWRSVRLALWCLHRRHHRKKEDLALRDVSVLHRLDAGRVRQVVRRPHGRATSRRNRGRSDFHRPPHLPRRDFRSENSRTARLERLGDLDFRHNAHQRDRIVLGDIADGPDIVRISRLVLRDLHLDARNSLLSSDEGAGIGGAQKSANFQRQTGGRKRARGNGRRSQRAQRVQRKMAEPIRGPEQPQGALRYDGNARISAARRSIRDHLLRVLHLRQRRRSGITKRCLNYLLHNTSSSVHVLFRNRRPNGTSAATHNLNHRLGNRATRQGHLLPHKGRNRN
uniref:Uncharacterized protein n=1 Tax=Photinus pyralis TaxID=7054 RepID=A0A1Y1MUY5_PHOPY